MIRYCNKVVFFSLLAAMIGFSSSAASADDGKLKVGFIVPSPIADVGWAHEIDRGRRYMEKKLGDKVETVIVENIKEGPNAALMMTQMVVQGVDMLVLGSFGYMKDGLALARKHRDVTFLHGTGYKQDVNFGTFETRSYQGAYVAGMAAAYVTESETLGAVAAYAIPIVLRVVNAFTLGARSVNPDIEVKVVWLNSWFNPAKAQAAARSLVSQGAGVLFSVYQDTPAVVSIAEQNQVYAVNLSSNMSKYAPNWLLTSIQFNWGPHFTKVARSVLNGTYESQAFWGGFGEGTLEMVAWSDDLTSEQRAKLNDTVNAIASDDLQVFGGPIKDRSGNLRVPKGEAMSDKEVFTMDWLVEGVVSSLPN